MSSGPSTESTSALEALLGPDARLDRDLLCRACGYNLRGLRVADRCPECNAPVEAAVKSDLLELADPRWLRRLESGTRTTMAAVIVLCAGVVGVLLMRPDHDQMHWPLLLLAAVTLMATVGAWQITTPMPQEGLLGWRLNARRLARFGLVAWVPAGAVTVLFVASGAAESAGMVLGCLTLALLALGQVALAGYFKKLAQRAQDPITGNVATLYGVVAGLSWSAFIAGAVLTLLASVSGPQGPGPPCCAGFGGLAGIVAGFLILVLPQRLAQRIRECARAAEATWGAPKPED